MVGRDGDITLARCPAPWLPSRPGRGTAPLRCLQRPPTVDAAVPACPPSVPEDQVRENRSLLEAGGTTVVQDDPFPGEFLVGKPAYNDTVRTIESDVLPPTRTGTSAVSTCCGSWLRTRAW